MSHLDSQSRLSIIEHEPLSPYTTYGIGGPARYFAKAHTTEELKALIDWARAKEVPIFILGKGSNTVFDDRGFNGLVILIKLREMHLDEEGRVKVGSGFSYARLGTLCSQSGWSGLEFASGIPGSVGGAVYMNAGASGSDTAQVLTHVHFMDPSGEIHSYSKEDFQFSYRHSAFQQKRGVILDAEFILHKNLAAKEAQKQIMEKRVASQPYDQKSAGCVFRNPTSIEMPVPRSAGAMIDEAGLKGCRVGSLEVSPLHANFLVNRGGGTAQDLFLLIEHVRTTIANKYNVNLELEIRKVDFEPTSWWVDAVAR